MVTSLKRSLRQLQKEMRYLEEKLLVIVKQAHQDLLTCLRTILGIGPKTAIMLVVLTGGFDGFTSARELRSYAGLTPLTIRRGVVSMEAQELAKWKSKVEKFIVYVQF